MDHADHVEHYPGDLADLAADLGDAARDEARGRPQLAAALRSGAGHVARAGEDLQRAWGICAPHMPPR